MLPPNPAPPVDPRPTRARVLVVDDAVVVRKVVSDALASDPAIEIAGTAANGRIALAKMQLSPPDLVVLDVEMPEMDGLATLAEIRRQWPRLPVIMFSALTQAGAAVTLECLAKGANDFVTKPVSGAGGLSETIPVLQSQLIPRIKALCRIAGPDRPLTTRIAATPAAASLPGAPAPAQRTRVIEAVLIGVSTGGPNALAVVVPALPMGLGVPVLIAQHMPPVFTKQLADRLAGKSQIGVVEGSEGLPATADLAVIAPGDFHLTVVKNGTARACKLNKDPPENSCRPAVDVLFRSAARAYGGNVLVVMLTGMGQDGLRGTRLLRDLGAQVIVQDEATSVVWGMPGAVAKAGLADAQLPLDAIAPEIARRVKAGRPGSGAKHVPHAPMPGGGP